MFVYYDRLEATYCGCFPLAPNRLVYSEIYPQCCLHDDCDELFQRLKNFCLEPTAVTIARKSLKIDFEKYSAVNLVPEFIKMFAVENG